MARTAEGWKLIWKRGIAHVRFRLQGRRNEVSTRTRDPVEAARLAAQIYADFVSGSVSRAASGALIHPGTELAELCADWIADVMPELGQGTDTTYEVYARHWCRHFQTIGNVTTPAIGAYQRARLGAVQRTTVVKERSALNRFLTWCKEKELIRAVPEFPALAKKATGTRHKQGRSAPLVELSPAEVEAILAALPVLNGRADAKGRRFHVRAFFETLYETGLRPEGTVDRLEGRDLTLAGLHIRPECDKNRWARVVPLSPRARAALESVGTRRPDEPIFGVHDRRLVFRKACIEALGPERGKLVTPYDLKHARATHLADAGVASTGIEFLTGTKAALDHYIHPTRRAGEEALRIAAGVSAAASFGGQSGAVVPGEECEGEDLNLHGSNPASTSTESENSEGGKGGEIGGEEAAEPPLSGARNDLSGARHPIAVWALALAADRVLARRTGVLLVRRPQRRVRDAG